MLEKDLEDRRVHDYVLTTRWSNIKIGMNTIPDINFKHRNNTQYSRDIHPILPKEDPTDAAEVLAAPLLAPRSVARNRAEEQEIVKGNKFR